MSDVSTDNRLVERCRGRDEAAFAALYDRHSAAVFGVCRAVLRDDALAEEATHDVFLNFWQHPEGFQPERGAFHGWLLRIARNRSIDVLRRQRERPFPTQAGESGADLDPLANLIDPDPEPLEQALRSSEGERVRGAVHQLTPEQQRLIELAYWRGLSQREIALALERPLGTVKTQIRVAMKRLLDLLDDEQTDNRPSHVEQVATQRDSTMTVSFQPSPGAGAPEV